MAESKALNDVSNILVVNLNSKKSTITDTLGLFTIEVKLMDSIRFTAVQYLKKEIVITNTILNQKLVTVYLIDNVINLNEVTITPCDLTGELDLDIEKLVIKPAITSSSLGLPNTNLEVMTQSERLLIVQIGGNIYGSQQLKIGENYLKLLAMHHYQ